MNKQNNDYINNLSIVVTTCCKYSDLWNNYAILLERYWPNHPNIILISDDKPVGFENFPYPIITKPGDYSFRLKEGLKLIKTKYILLTLDDYLICNSVKTDKISYLIQTMESNKLDYCRLFHRAKTNPWFEKKNNLKILPLKKTCYEINLYTSIWNKESLEKIIKYDENPWKFEVRLTRRAKENHYKCISCIDLSVFPFVDTIRKGKYIRKAYSFLKKNDLFISTRPVRTKKEEMKLWVKTKLSDIAPKFVHNWYNKAAKTKPYSYYANTDD